MADPLHDVYRLLDLLGVQQEPDKRDEETRNQVLQNKLNLIAEDCHTLFRKFEIMLLCPG